MKRVPWLAVPLATVDGLIRIYERQSGEWPREAAAVDLARHLDLASSGRAHEFPSRRALAKRWGWTEARVRGLLSAPHEWSDPTKETAEPIDRPKVAQRSPKGRPTETVAPEQSGAVSPNARPTLAQRSPSIRPDVLPDGLENVAFEYGLSEVGTIVAAQPTEQPTTHNNTQKRVRDLPPDPTLLTVLLQTTRSHTMHALIADDIRRRSTGSRPTEATAAADNGEDTTHPPEAAAPSLPSTGDAAPATTSTTAPPAQARREVAPGAEAVQAGAFTLAPPAKKGKAKKGKPDDAAILAIAAQVDRMMGRPGAALPGSGRWKMLVTAVNEAGADRVLARVTAMADAAQGLPSPASAIYAQMAPSNYGTDPILRGNNGWTIKLDDAIEAARAAVSRSCASGDAGGITSRGQAREGSRAAKTPNQGTSWPDVLRDLGSDPGAHPDDGPLRQHWPRVRQAIYTATKTAGDAWETWCKADDRVRVRVERLLTLVAA